MKVKILCQNMPKGKSRTAGTSAFTLMPCCNTKQKVCLSSHLLKNMKTLRERERERERDPQFFL
jgi:hypothetical protein